MKTPALFVTGTDRVELIEANIPDPGPREVIVESLYTSISPGTELRCMAGGQPGKTFPYIPGYSTVGRIIARGSETTIAEGTLVFCQGTEKADRPLCWGAHMGHALRSEEFVFPIPKGVDPLSATLTKLSAIAYRGVRLAKTLPHEQVAAVGLGPIGQLAARLHRLTGARVVAADIQGYRVDLAKAAGLEAFVPERGLVEGFRAYQPDGADVVVDATGAVGLLQQTVQLARMKPWDDTLTDQTRFVIQGSYAGDLAFDYHVAFVRELAVLLPRDCQSRDLRAALRFLETGSLKTRDLISRLCQPEDAQEVYLDLRAAKPGLMTAVFSWARSH
jgi:3-hydroxyethyl bacteriochlorophyllide a dehydrogenase